jgi:hypothetical protein
MKPRILLLNGLMLCSWLTLTAQDSSIAFAQDQARLDSSKKRLAVYVIGTEFTGYAHIGWPKQLLMYVSQAKPEAHTYWYSTRRQYLQSGAERSAKIRSNVGEPAEAFLVFDWSRETRIFKASSVTKAVQWLHLAIEETFDSLGWQRSEVELHLIGHSRGCVVAMGLGHFYQEPGHEIALLSTLDPHPVAHRQADLYHSWVKLNASNCPEANQHRRYCLEMEPAPAIRQLSNYYRQDGKYEDAFNCKPLGIGQFDGLLIQGAQNYLLNNQVMRQGKWFVAVKGNPHVEIIAWYFGVDLDEKGFPPFSEAALNAVRQ